MDRHLCAALLVPPLVVPMTSHHPGAGLITGPAAWAVSTQAGYATAPLICAHGAWWIVALSAALLASLSLAGAYISARGFPVAGAWAGDGQPRHLLRSLGVGAGVLFALVILLQGAAALALTGCER
jgi:hypothetical protein